jgi:alpha-glucosidase (family GH31 glycosyl hydrolase)
VRLYVPDGEWVDAWTGETLRGRAVVERAAPLDEIPLLVAADRAETLLPVFAGLPSWEPALMEVS